MQLGFYFDQSRCIGCHTCSVSCADWHDTEEATKWLRVSTIEQGDFPDVFVSFLVLPCCHCAEPLCAVVCPAGAISKREEDGIVIVDRDKCRESARCGGIAEWPGNGLTFAEMEAPCKVSCPIHLSVPGYVTLIAKGKYKEALSLIRERMPLPATCGRVCHHPCEEACRRQEVDQPVAIAALRRFVSDLAADDAPTPAPRTKDEKVAIVGSGPAGLAAAYDLVRKGYGVTIFEALPVAGGMLAVGIPQYRLPKDVLQRDIDYICGLGVEIKTNTPVGKDVTIEDLKRRGYAAVFLAVGAHRGEKMGIPGEELQGVYDALHLLWDVNLGNEVQVGKRVAVIGGGNTAIDSARVALRKGAEEVHVFYRRQRADMPAIKGEIEAAEEEGIHIHVLTAPTKIWGDDGKNGKVSGLGLINMEPGEIDESGRRTPQPVKGSEYSVCCDTVIVAIGQRPDTSFLGGGGVQLREDGTIAVHSRTLATERGGIFAGGDAVSGPKTVIEAIAAGQRAAISIDRFLRGLVVDDGHIEWVDAADIKVDIPPDVAKAERQPMPSLAAVERRGSFAEVAQGFTAEVAIAEASRCLNCAGHLCRDVCPYVIPRFGTDTKMQKCNLCVDRVDQGQQPICVEACPMWALDFGSLDQLKAKYGEVSEAVGFAYSAETSPAIVFKPKVRRSGGVP